MAGRIAIKQLAQDGAIPGQILTWGSVKPSWEPATMAVPTAELFVADGTTATFATVYPIPASYAAATQVERNGLTIRRVAANPVGRDQFVVLQQGITLGIAPDLDEEIQIRYWFFQ